MAEGRTVGGFGLSERQRQQMAHTLSLSPTPLELPEEDDGGDEVKLPAMASTRGLLGLTHSSLIPCRRARADLSCCASLPLSAVGTHSSHMSTLHSAASSHASSSLFSSTLFPRVPSTPPSANPLSAAILYVHSLVSTSPADVAGLQVRDFVLEIGPYSKDSGWEVNMIEDLALTIRHWPDTHPNQPLRVKVLRRIPPDSAHSIPDVLWARTKANGNGDGNGQGNGKAGGGGHPNGGGKVLGLVSGSSTPSLLTSCPVLFA